MEQTDFLLRPARTDELPAIMEVMHAAMRSMAHPEWFFPDEEDYMRDHIDGPGGFCLVAEAPGGTLAAYFTVKFAGLDSGALGRKLGFSAAAHGPDGFLLCDAPVSGQPSGGPPAAGRRSAAAGHAVPAFCGDRPPGQRGQPVHGAAPRVPHCPRQLPLLRRKTAPYRAKGYIKHAPAHCGAGACGIIQAVFCRRRGRRHNRFGPVRRNRGNSPQSAGTARHRHGTGRSACRRYIWGPAGPAPLRPR